MKLKYFYLAAVLSVLLVTVVATIKFKEGFYSGKKRFSLSTPLESKPQEKNLPLLQYSIPNLKQYPYQASQITVKESLHSGEDYSSFKFSFNTTDREMTGVITTPNLSELDTNTAAYPAIIMLRGYVPKELYSPGVGTKNAATVFAQNGFVTLSLDFFGFGDSSSEPDNSWEARFIKPVNVLELLASIDSSPLITLESQARQIKLNLDSSKIGIWAHSNGGQIALSVLEATSKPIPTTLWAPVTAPFPYSILFFSDEHQDEGKDMRAWLAKFEQDYDVFAFTITQHLNLLSGPLQIHHGTADEAALKIWSDEFIAKIDQENERREKLITENNINSTDSAQTASPKLNDSEAAKQPAGSSKQINSELISTKPDPSPIELNYYSYPGANHNLQPQNNWNQAIARDLSFFKSSLNVIK